MNKSDIFYFDIDGTLLDTDTQTVSESTISAVNTLKEKGYKIVLCTGRPPGSVTNTQFRTLAKWDAYILANGGSILDENYNEVENLLCTPEFLNKLIELYDGPIILEGEEVSLVNGVNDNVEKMFYQIDIELPKVIKYTNEIVHKITLENLDGIEGRFDNPIFDGFSYNINAFNMYEIYPEESNKHIAIEKVNKLLNGKRFTYFGDGTNDIGALELADVGVAMGNAKDVVKDAADHITTDVSNHGISNALKHYKII